jgi:HPt (histidine-containing phosphotransfer) domain-containing protein
MDVQMPEMDGFEATKFIIHKPQLPKRPVIVAMTAFALEGDKEKCLEAGMNDYISKPFLIEEIVERIRKWVPAKTTQARTENKSTVIRTLDILNMNTIGRLRQIMGESDSTFFNQVLQMFITQADEQVTAIARAVAANNIQEVGSLAHKLKGSALNIGADTMAETCRMLELQARGLDGNDMKALSDRLEREYALTRVEILKVHG